MLVLPKLLNIDVVFVPNIGFGSDVLLKPNAVVCVVGDETAPKIDGFVVCAEPNGWLGWLL